MEITNLLDVGDIVYIADYDSYFVVREVKPIPLAKISISGTLPASGSLENQKIEYLKLENGQVGQFHLLPIDDIDVVVKVGGSKGWTSSTKNIVARISKWHTDNISMMWRLTLFWQIEDEDLIFDIYNNTTSDIVDPTMYVVGFKYLLEPIEKEKAVGKKLKVIRASDTPKGYIAIRKEHSITGGE